MSASRLRTGSAVSDGDPESSGLHTGNESLSHRSPEVCVIITPAYRVVVRFVLGEYR